MKKIVLVFLSLLLCTLSCHADSNDYQGLRKQIGQMLIVGFRGTSADGTSYITKAIKELNIGGVVLFDYDGPGKSFPRNITGPEQVKKLCLSLQKSSPVPLIIAVDAEGGMINRLKPEYGLVDSSSKCTRWGKNRT